nr:MAG TPA: hypothetical protein [Caudoviricetes sp.]
MGAMLFSMGAGEQISFYRNLPIAPFYNNKYL